VSALSQKKRGFSTIVETAYGKPFPDCGVCVKECPVVALDWKIKEQIFQSGQNPL
jgi:Pyruvate/2-oxoacid:ferredoxin oxidoreductase delta subunit